ncbi:MAG: Gfo/Idh/MocA family oxidoreductase, partial [Rhodothermales bacterium]|nr:Gfo/Idh/MocA family oxidoreductase [Rhodothermales bacterium]
MKSRSSELTAILVGCGDISNVWLESISRTRGLDLVGLVDLDTSVASSQAARHGFADITIDSHLKRVLKKVNPDIVFDCTVPSAHATVTIDSLRHGCHVLGEKPLSDSLRSARRMIDAAAKADKFYAVMQNRRFDPNIRRLRRFVESQRIGALTTLNSDFYIGAHMG